MKQTSNPTQSRSEHEKELMCFIFQQSPIQEYVSFLWLKSRATTAGSSFIPNSTRVWNFHCTREGSLPAPGISSLKRMGIPKQVLVLYAPGSLTVPKTFLLSHILGSIFWFSHSWLKYSNEISFETTLNITILWIFPVNNQCIVANIKRQICVRKSMTQNF